MERIDVVICGSINHNGTDMVKVRDFLKMIFKDCIGITDPISVNEEYGGKLTDCQRYYVDKIRYADLVIIIPKRLKENLAKNAMEWEMGESTSYEYAIAKHFNKPIQFIDPEMIPVYTEIEVKKGCAKRSGKCKCE